MGLCGVTFILLLFQRYWLYPEIQYLGRLIDFVPPDVPSAPRARFWTFHGLFSGTEVLKLVLLGAIGLKMLVRSDTRRRPSRSTDSNGEELEIR